MGRTKIKMCGFTRAEDIQCAAALGVDAFGMVFFAPSPRSLTPEQARVLRGHIPLFSSLVALFVNPSHELVNEVIRLVNPDILQFHGDETPELCMQYNKPYIKALRVGAPGLNTAPEIQAVCEQFDSAQAILFDSYTDSYGGSGRSFNWSILNDVNVPRVVLSGGLHAGNVGQGIANLAPYAVDISSGIEQAKGIKCPVKMAEFVHQVSLADQRLST